MIYRCSLLVVSLVVVTLIGGCGSSKGTPVNGTLVVNGKPYVPPDKGVATVALASADPAAKLLPASGEADPKTGAFTLQNLTIKGVMPGKYKVAVTVAIMGQYGKDVFKDAFAESNTPLTVDITPDTKSIVVDLGAKTVTKQ